VDFLVAMLKKPIVRGRRKPLLSVLDSLPGHKALMMQDPGKPVSASSG
jgi:hypothetical protein